MKKMMLFLSLLASFGAQANAAEWKRVLICQDDQATFVADRDSRDPEQVQFVIEGREAVQYVSASVQGNSIMAPENFKIYDNGNKLVINGLLASNSLNPAVVDPYRITVSYRTPAEEILSWTSG